MTGARRNLAILCMAYGFSAALIWHQIGVDLTDGGSSWRQGDWLINVEGGPIRRGWLGSVLIRLSDATGIDLLTLAFVLPVGLLALILASLVRFSADEGPGDRLLLILLSPGFVLFWGADAESILRKEVLIYAAFLPLISVAGQAGRRHWALIASVLLFAMAAAGHEMSVFFVPALVVAIIACRRFDAASGLAVATVVMLGALTLGYAMRFPGVPDMRSVCAPLLTRGLSPAICEGAIRWLEYDLKEVRDALLARVPSPREGTVVVGYAASLLPFAVALRGRADAGRGLVLILLAGLPFVPLWIVALDWGRWINAHVAVMVFLLLIGLRRGQIQGLQAPLPRPLFVATLAVCLAIGIHHVGGQLRPGLIGGLLTTFFWPAH